MRIKRITETKAEKKSGEMPITNNNLTDKEEDFCQQYTIDKNATKAAERAKYSKRSAASIGCENLTKPKIRKRIKELLAQTHEDLDISRERIIREYGRIAFHDTRKLYDDDGNLIPIHELDDDTAAAIGGVEVQTIMGENGTSTKTHKIKVIDKKGALDSLSKTEGMFIDKHEHTGAGGEPIKVEDASAKDVALRIAFLLKRAEE